MILLKLIAEQPRHGYELIRAIEELRGGVYVPSPGVVYPTLTMLQEMGQIEEAASDGARKAFAVTPEGATHLASKAEDVPTCSTAWQSSPMRASAAMAGPFAAPCRT